MWHCLHGIPLGIRDLPHQTGCSGGPDGEQPGVCGYVHCTMCSGAQVFRFNCLEMAREMLGKVGNVVRMVFLWVNLGSKVSPVVQSSEERHPKYLIGKDI